MSIQSPAFAFDEPAPPLVLVTARAISTRLVAGVAVSRADLSSMLTEYFGGSDADGRWSVRDAHAALELAQVLYLQGYKQLDLATPAPEAEELFACLDERLPTQSTRSEEQIAWQQFATPPRLAWLAARACALSEHDFVLEPSAGTGMLAVWAAKAGARIALNEISPLRRDCLGQLFPGGSLTGHDGELIDELLDPAVCPNVVLMNPPFSHGLERGHDSRTGARHLRSAWNRLATGGRLVAIMPEWFDTGRFLAELKGQVALRLNAAIERAFVRQGTGITTRLLVLDKTELAIESLLARTNDFAEIAALVDALPPRARAVALSEPSHVPIRTPFQLVSASRRPLPSSARVVAAPVAVRPLTYQPLENPPPIDTQVGHYLPYRPSRIVIYDAAEHPTPLVESVAMGSIAAPIPHAVPQLPDGLIGNGLLSAAQAETLIYAATSPP